MSAWLWIIYALLFVIGALVLSIPVLFLVAWRERHARNSGSRPPAPCPKELAPFHQAEFSSLKAEIAELLKSINANFQYAAIGSTGVLTWIITETPKDEVNASLLRMGLWLPLVLAGFLGCFTLAQYIRIGEMGDYLAILEKSLGSPDLGWEEFFKGRVRTIGTMVIVGWAVLLAADLVVGLLGNEIVSYRSHRAQTCDFVEVPSRAEFLAELVRAG